MGLIVRHVNADYSFFIIPVTFYVAERFGPKAKPKTAPVPPVGATPAPIHGGANGERRDEDEPR